MPATPDGGWILDDREVEPGCILTPEEREAIRRRPWDPSKMPKAMPKLPDFDPPATP